MANVFKMLCWCSSKAMFKKISHETEDWLRQWTQPNGPVLFYDYVEGEALFKEACHELEKQNCILQREAAYWERLYKEEVQNNKLTQTCVKEQVEGLYQDLAEFRKENEDLKKDKRCLLKMLKRKKRLVVKVEHKPPPLKK